MQVIAGAILDGYSTEPIQIESDLFNVRNKKGTIALNCGYPFFIDKRILENEPAKEEQHRIDKKRSWNR
ncbi:hypothetical protein NCCP28_28930 [Niallia sp. NCCP-28]|nr:hypothetical protein NCCP28_28930 [Niallia sp. NCCP-28]